MKHRLRIPLTPSRSWGSRTWLNIRAFHGLKRILGKIPKTPRPPGEYRSHSSERHTPLQEEAADYLFVLEFADSV